MTGNHEFDLSVPQFPAPFRRFLVEDGILSYKYKILGFPPFLFILGALITLATNTFHVYIVDWGVYVIVIVASVSLFGIVYVCKQVDDTLSELDKTFEHSKNEEFKGFIDEIKSERTWCSIPYRYWYYLHTYGLAAGFLTAYSIGLWGSRSWGGNVDPTAGLVNDIFAFILISILGYWVGLGFNLAWEYAYYVNKYCKGFVKAENVELLPSEDAGGLKPLGKLALTMDIAVATPALWAFALYHAMWMEGTFLASLPVNLAYLGIYCIVLAIVFFYPISPLHTTLVKAKRTRTEKVGSKIKQVFREEKLDSLESYRFISDLLSTHSALRKAPTWPLDLRMSIGTAVTILFPLIGGAILQIWFEVLLKLFI